MKDSIIERVARAVFGVIWNAQPEAFHPSFERERELWDDTARAAIAAMPGWQPVASAPKSENAEFLVWSEGLVYLVRRSWDDYLVAIYGDEMALDGAGDIIYVVKATHWMLLPEPPK